MPAQPLWADQWALNAQGVRQTVLIHRVHPALVAHDGIVPGHRAADLGDLSMAEANQMLNGQP
ncbi:MAG: hypothetical protein IPK52_21270 [Chloroflexi bacterium]|nr:hypothetical protein [Chloroflexota bacterium]